MPYKCIVTCYKYIHRQGWKKECKVKVIRLVPLRPETFFMFLNIKNVLKCNFLSPN